MKTLKKIAFLSSIMTMVFFLFVNAASAVTIEGNSSFTLFAGQSINAGTVDLAVNGDTLVVSYNTIDGWGLEEVHLFIGENLADMPQAKNGNPKIGNFPYIAQSLNGAVSYSFYIPLSALGGEPYVCDKTFIVAAHAALKKDNGDGTFQTETGWGDGEKMVTKGNWATYFSILFSCDGTEPPNPDPECETAFAYGDLTFIDLGITDSRWGWVISLDGPQSGVARIYAGAAQNDITKGEYVGDLSYDYDGTTLVLTFDMLSGFYMEETHVYASNQLPDTIAPGQYGNIHDLDQAITDSFSIPVSGSTIYIIAHAVVCAE